MKKYEIPSIIREGVSETVVFNPLRMPDGADCWEGVDAEISRSYVESGISKYNKKMLKAFDEVAELASSDGLKFKPYDEIGISEDMTPEEIIAAWKERN